MKTIKDDVVSELVIKKSKFICHLYYVKTLDEIKKLLQQTQNDYKDATHNCYAYILNGDKRMSDDGEPSGTAGIPILNILEVNNLNHVLAVVTRYFGGIKLGANGLVRAYAKSVNDALNQTSIVNLINGIEIKITFKYDDIKQIDYLLKDYQITNKEYHDLVTYQLIAPLSNNISILLKDYLITYEEGNSILIKED